MNELISNQINPHYQVMEIMTRIYQRGLTTSSGGNISMMDNNGDIWITPSAVDKGSLKPGDIVCVKSDGTITGKHQPSSEFPFHKAIYNRRPDLRAIIHIHSPALVSFSIVHQVPNTNVTPVTKHICGPVGYAKYALPGSEMLGKLIADEFDKGFHAVILENHGAVIGGESISKAFQRFETLEFGAQAIIFGKMPGREPKYLTDEQIKNYEAHTPGLLPELETVGHPPDEKRIRREVIQVVHRACNQGLMLSTFGTVSARWHENDFLVTPEGISLCDIQENDIVQVKDGKREPGKIPSRSTMLHQEIYRLHPQINSVILAQSPCLMGFIITSAKFNVRTIPESWIFLQDVPNVEFGSLVSASNTIPELISPVVPAVLINNDCVVITGNKLSDTFDRLEVAEFTAKSLIMGASLGTVEPMSSKQVEELKRNYFP